MEIDNPVLAAIAKRTSVRAYTADPVEKDEILALLRAAMAAPSGKNVQPWVFVVVQDKDTLEELADVLPNGSMLRNAPLAIMVGSDMFIAEAGTPGLPFWMLDCSAATQNILLAAQALGLGAVWLGVTPIEERVKYVREILHLPAHIAPLNLIALGHPKDEVQPKDKFDESRIHWERW